MKTKLVTPVFIGASAFFMLGAYIHLSAAEPAVQTLPKPQVKIQAQNGTRIITTNSIPDHETGRFPNRGNPNRIQAVTQTFRMPVNPNVARNTTVLRLHPFGIAINGIVFDPGANEFWNNDRNSGWQYEPLSGAVPLGLDQNTAHVQPNGLYHYHGLPTPLLKRMNYKSKMALVGYAADGFPIYGPYGYKDPNATSGKLVSLKSSYRVKKGSRPSGRRGPGGTYDGTFVADYEYVKGLGDLDECNGRYGVTPEYPKGTYYYVLTENWPIIPRVFRGTPDQSFMRHGPGPGGPGGPGGPPPRGRRPPPHRHPH